MNFSLKLSGFLSVLLSVLFSVVLFSVSVFGQGQSSVRQQAIYGQDDRKDWYDTLDPRLLEWAHATAVLIYTNDLVEKPTEFFIKAPTYESSNDLCPGSRFGKQKTPGFCSGFLVGDDLLVTAGHCIGNMDECRKTTFAFDYAVTRRGLDPKYIAKRNVFRCQEIIGRDLSPTMDYAVIRLDRSTGRKPFDVRRISQPVRGTKLTMIGHPAGLPSKISDGGEILQVNDKIIASVDAFGGNSGSVVINRFTGKAEGILVAGEPDFERVGKCMIEKVCGPECNGEEVFPISTISYLIPDLPVSESRSQGW